MDTWNDFEIVNDRLEKYSGAGGVLVIPEGVTGISDNVDVFPENMIFTTVFLPNSLQRDLWRDWRWPNYLKTEAYEVSPDHPILSCADGVLYDKEQTELLACPALKKGEILLPKTCNHVVNGALSNACDITAIQVDPEHSSVCSVDGLVYSANRTKLYLCPAGKKGIVTIPAETSVISAGALVGCKYITEFVVPTENKKFQSIDGVLYNKSGSRLLKYPEGREGEFVVPDHVHSLNDSAFHGVKLLTKLTIPESVIDLPFGAFHAMDGLKELIMPASAYTGYEIMLKSLAWLELTGNADYYTWDGVVYRRWRTGEKELVCCPRGREHPVTVPGDITEIRNTAFAGCCKIPEILFDGNMPKIPPSTFEDCEMLRIPSRYLRIADKVPTAFTLRADTFDETDLQWLAVHQSAKGWKDAVYKCVNPMNKENFLQGMLDILEQTPKIPKATGMNVLEFVQMWQGELKSAQIRRLRDILTAKKCSAVVKLMDSDSNLQEALNGEEASGELPCGHPIEQLVRDNMGSVEPPLGMRKRIKTGIAYRNCDKLCHPDVLLFIVAAYAKTMDPNHRRNELCKNDYIRAVRHPLADQVAETLDQDAFRVFLDQYATGEEGEYIPALDGSLLALGRYGTSAQISKLISCMRKWEKYGSVGKRAIVIARGGLMLSDTREAMLAVDKAGCLDYYAKLRGSTADVIRDTVLADFGLDDDGCMVCSLGNGKSVEIRLNQDLSLGLFDLSANKAVKSIPKKGADPECYNEATAVFSDMKKNAKKIAKSRNDQLFQAFLNKDLFDAQSWKRTYLHNPLLRQVASLLVWEQENVTFTVLHKDTVRFDGSAVTLTNAPIYLAHPMEMKADLVKSWQKYYTDSSLKQMFPQIWEPVFDPDSVHSNRYEGCTVPVLTLAGQKKHGIGVDGLSPYSDSFELWLTECALETKPSDWRYIPGTNDDLFYTLGKFTFRRFSRWTNHIVGWFDRYLIADKIAKDDITVSDMLQGFTLAQITDFIHIASENNCTNVTAVLLDYRNRNFAEFDPMDEFALEL